MKDEILSLQGGQTKFVWMGHVELDEEIGEWTGRLGLDRKGGVVVVERGNEVEAEVEREEEGGERIWKGKMLDAKEGEWQCVWISGWESEKDYEEKKGRVQGREVLFVGGNLERMYH